MLIIIRIPACVYLFLIRRITVINFHIVFVLCKKYLYKKKPIKQTNEEEKRMRTRKNREKNWTMS